MLCNFDPYAYYYVLTYIYCKVNRFCIVKIYVQWNDRMNFKIRTTKDKPNYWWLMTLIKRKNIHPIFKCWDLATHITQSTRSTQWAQTSLADADHYSHMPTVKILRLGGERLPPSKKKKKKKKKKKFWIITFTTIWLCYYHYGVFCSFIFAHLLIAEGPHVTQIL